MNNLTSEENSFSKVYKEIINRALRELTGSTNYWVQVTEEMIKAINPDHVLEIAGTASENAFIEYCVSSMMTMHNCNFYRVYRMKQGKWFLKYQTVEEANLMAPMTTVLSTPVIGRKIWEIHKLPMLTGALQHVDGDGRYTITIDQETHKYSFGLYIGEREIYFVDDINSDEELQKCISGFGLSDQEFFLTYADDFDPIDPETDRIINAINTTLETFKGTAIVISMFFSNIDAVSIYGIARHYGQELKKTSTGASNEYQYSLVLQGEKFGWCLTVNFSSTILVDVNM